MQRREFGSLVKPGEQVQVPFCRVSNSGQDWVDGAALGCWICSLDGDWLGADPLDAGTSLGGVSVSGASLDGGISLGDGGTSLKADGATLGGDSVSGSGASLDADPLDPDEVPLAVDSL
jgi:hypothetical protein